MSNNGDDPRYVRNWKCQVSVGELYRGILAKLSDKDIKRALHKYRDLMPRQSDWNRKLTQATTVPELGFRYLYRCGQIDESNHRTMQKMLKYIDRQDVLPYFDTILYNTNMANQPLVELQKSLLDKVSTFLELTTTLSDAEVHPEPPYTVLRYRDPVEVDRMTRLQRKRKTEPTSYHCQSLVKRSRQSVHGSLSTESTSSCSHSTESNHTEGNITYSLSQVCSRSRSSVMANALTGPAVQCFLSTSLLNIAADFQHLLHSAPSFTKSMLCDTSSRHQRRLSHKSIKSLQLLGMSTLSLGLGEAFQVESDRLTSTDDGNATSSPSPSSSSSSSSSSTSSGQQSKTPPELFNLTLAANALVRPVGGCSSNVPGGSGSSTGPPNSQRSVQRDCNRPPESSDFGRLLCLKQVILPGGGVGVSGLTNSQPVLFYYCMVKLRLTLDIGPSLRPTPSNAQAEFHDPLGRQMMRFISALDTLKARIQSDLICELRFNQLSHLESFWRDYRSGVLEYIITNMLQLSNPYTIFNTPNDQSHIHVPPLPNCFSSGLSDDSNSSYLNDPVINCSIKDSLISLANTIKGCRNYPTEYPSRQRFWPNHFRIHPFVSKREYENGRLLLVRNLRSMPATSSIDELSSILDGFQTCVRTRQ